MNTMDDSTLFFSGFNNNRIWSGFTADEIEGLCSRKDSVRRTPWISWTSELYGGGQGHRQWLGWPSWLPLPAAADHGIVGVPRLLPRHVEAIGSLPYLSARPEVIAQLHSLGMQAYLAPSPWLFLIKHYELRQRSDAQGRVLFFPHTLPGYEASQDYLTKFVEFAKAQQDVNEVLVVCLHMHDVKAGVHRRLLNEGLPVVTAGNTSSGHFFRRWVRILSAFESGISPRPGSESVLFAAIGGAFGMAGPQPAFREYLLERMSVLGLVEPQATAEADAAIRHRADLMLAFPYPPTRNTAQQDLVRRFSNPVGAADPIAVRRALVRTFLRSKLRRKRRA